LNVCLSAFCSVVVLIFISLMIDRLGILMLIDL
jgi:hypothetical protein